MIVSSNVITHMSGGSSSRTLVEGDSVVQLPSVVQPVLETMLETSIGAVGITLIGESSLVVSATKAVAASSSASATTLFTLPKGLYTISLSLNSRFVGASAAGGATPDIWVDVVNTALSINALVTAQYAVAGFFSQNLKFRISPVEAVLMRYRNAATGVGQTIDSHLFVSVERHL